MINPHQTRAKFEKMELDPRLETHGREEVPIDQVWGSSTTEVYLNLLKEKSCAYNDKQDTESRRTCENFIECQSRFSELYFQCFEAHKDKPSYETSRSSHMAAITMLVGMFIGALFGSFFTYAIIWTVQTCRERSKSSNETGPRSTREMRREFRERNQFERE